MLNYHFKYQPVAILSNLIVQMRTQVYSCFKREYHIYHCTCTHAQRRCVHSKHKKVSENHFAFVKSEQIKCIFLFISKRNGRHKLKFSKKKKKKKRVSKKKHKIKPFLEDAHCYLS